MHNLLLIEGSLRKYKDCLKTGSHYPIFSLALFQLIEMLIRVNNFFELKSSLSKNWIRKLDLVN